MVRCKYFAKWLKKALCFKLFVVPRLKALIKRPEELFLPDYDMIVSYLNLFVTVFSQRELTVAPELK